MSEIIRIKTLIIDVDALTTAAEELNLSVRPNAHGYLIQTPGHYWIACEKITRQTHPDLFVGAEVDEAYQLGYDGDYAELRRTVDDLTLKYKYNVIKSTLQPNEWIETVTDDEGRIIFDICAEDSPEMAVML